MRAADVRTSQARAMTEAQLSEHIRQLCKTLGLLAYHTHTSRFSAAGFPDWCVVGANRLLWRELKTEKGKTSPAQDEWLDRLAAVGEDAAVWRPSDLLSGRVARELTELAGRAAS